MPTTYTLIASNTVGSGGAATVTFSSIPSTYTDLVIKSSTRSDGGSGGTGFSYTFNGSSSSYSRIVLFGSGSAAGSASASTAAFGINNGPDTTASTFASNEIYIPNYAGSANKSISLDGVQENNASTAFAIFSAGLWSNTSAITSIAISGTGNFVQYSSFYLYGIKNS